MVSTKLIANAESAATFLTLMGNEKRLLIMSYLIDGEMSVGAIAEKVALSQSALSQHLAKLQGARPCRDPPRPADDLLFLQVRRRARSACARWTAFSATAICPRWQRVCAAPGLDLRLRSLLTSLTIFAGRGIDGSDPDRRRARSARRRLSRHPRARSRPAGMAASSPKARWCWTCCCRPDASRPNRCWFSKTGWPGSTTSLRKAPADLPVYVATSDVMDAIAGFHMHRGILAIGRKRRRRSRAEACSTPCLRTR